MKKLIGFILCAAFLLADSAGPRGGTGAGSGWTSPTNTAAEDGLFATCSIPASGACGSSHTVTALGFAIPAGATVNGIEVSYKQKCSANASCSTSTADGGAVFITGCTGTSNNNGDAMAWTTTNATSSLGSASDMWGLTCTVAQVNATAFGVKSDVVNISTTSSRTASIDYIAVTVYYTPAGGGGARRRVILSQTRSAGHPA